MMDNDVIKYSKYSNRGLLIWLDTNVSENLADSIFRVKMEAAISSFHHYTTSQPRRSRLESSSPLKPQASIIKIY
jgi:hypothetical protein